VTGDATNATSLARNVVERGRIRERRVATRAELGELTGRFALATPIHRDEYRVFTRVRVHAARPLTRLVGMAAFTRGGVRRRGCIEWLASRGRNEQEQCLHRELMAR
jgi:hypothetical protein